MINTKLSVHWAYWWVLAFRLDIDWGWSFSLGLHIDLNPPSLDIFFLWFCIGVTTRAHAEWIKEQQDYYMEDQNGWASE